MKQPVKREQLQKPYTAKNQEQHLIRFGKTQYLVKIKRLKTTIFRRLKKDEKKRQKCLRKC